jgi:glycosyltransferase involved in cell wall biosynthesis
MACGLPVVACRVGGIPVLVRDGRTGVLVPERDSIKLAEAIDSLLSDRDTARTFGDRARCIIENRVNYDAVADYFTKLYKLAADNVPVHDIPAFDFDERPAQ